MLVHHPGYLRTFTKTFETTEALQQKRIKVELPAPGAAILKLEVPEKFAAATRKKKFQFTASQLVSLGTDQMYLPGTENVSVNGDTTLSATLTNLAPTGYWMTAGEEALT